MGHTVSVDFVMPMEIAGVSSLACNATVIPASKPLLDISEFAVSVAKGVAVREAVDVICHLLAKGWILLTHTGFAHWVIAAIAVLYAWVIAAISWLLALIFDN